MKRIFSSLATALLLCAVAPAATVSTTFTLTGTTTISATGYLIAGQATLTNVGSGTFSSTIPLSGLTGATASAPYTITLSGGDAGRNLHGADLHPFRWYRQRVGHHFGRHRQLRRIYGKFAGAVGHQCGFGSYQLRYVR